MSEIDIFKEKPEFEYDDFAVNVATRLNLIIKKLAIGQFVSDITHKGSRETIRFTNQYVSEREFVFQYNGVLLAKYKQPDFKPRKYSSRQASVEFPITSISLNSKIIDKYKNYLYFFKENFEANHLCKISLRFSLESFPSIDQDKIQKNINNIMFYELNKNHIFPLLLGLNDYYIAKDISSQIKKEFTISNIIKLKNLLPYLENGVPDPSPDSIDKMISTFKVFKTCKQPFLKYGLVGFYTNDKLITVTFMGMPIIKEATFEKFKYVTHPGIKFLAWYFEAISDIDRVERNLFKATFKRI